ncbi:hypothetical protein MOQ_002290 [Trypanosoma cruzi marinkellei]|uniref:End-binding protein 1 n=1 Tax=Trypanosoma cruzi marinkellei TaxID=85056 RepID=K2NES3_TRYCR|nr:hypothetical protein MOQ_002290 [Trypanosoma cruzi marinkellei]
MDHGRMPASLQVVSSKESRTELLAWLNELIQRNAASGGHSLPRLHKVEQCGNCVPYVVLLPSLLPTAYPPLMTKAKTNAKHEFDAVVNLKLFTDALQKNGIPRPILLTEESDKIIKGAYQANLQLLQWFRGLYDVLSQNQGEGQARNHSSGELPEHGTAGACGRTGSTHLPKDHESQPIEVDKTSTVVTVLKENSLRSYKAPSGRVSGSSLPPSAHSQEVVAKLVPLTTKTASPFHDPLSSSDTRPSVAGRQPSQGRAGRVSTGRHETTMRSLSASKNRHASTARTPLRGAAGDGAAITRPVSSMMRNSNGKKRLEAERDPVAGPIVRMGGKEKSLARPNAADSLQTVAATSTTTNTTNNTNTLYASRKSSVTRPLLDCRNTDTNGRFVSPMAGKKRLTAQRCVPKSASLSTSQNAPTALIQMLETDTPAQSRHGSQSISEGGSDDSATASEMLIRVRNERQFYYDKLRQIESIVGPLVNKNETSREVKHLAQSVLEVLYAVS